MPPFYTPSASAAAPPEPQPVQNLIVLKNCIITFTAKTYPVLLQGILHITVLAEKLGKSCKFDRFLINCSSESTTEYLTAPEMAVLLEVEGVLMDVYRLGNRQAFNLAFRKLGLDCANWSEPVYLDLVRKSAGDEERKLILFFNRIGWPTSVATSEKGSFMKNVLREKKNALDELVTSQALSLRPGAEELIDDACKVKKTCQLSS